MISLAGIRKQYASQIVFNNLSVSFYDNDRVALIGRNGTGKTSLLRLIVGKDEPDSGSVSVSAGSSVGYLPQEVETVRDATPLEIVLEPFSHLLSYDEVYEAAAQSASGGDHRHVKRALDKIDALQAQIDHVDAFSLASRAKSIMAGLGIPDDKWEKAVQNLSGGYRMRVMLARLLLLSPSTLLLDEPTNHLDMDSLVWLESFLRRYRGGLIVVSHDRDFLNRVTSVTAELFMGSIIVYKGAYDAYMIYKEERERSEQSTRVNIERQIAQKERFIERFRAKATKASQVQSRVKSVEELKDRLPDVPVVQKTVRFRFPSPPVQSGGVPFKLESVSAAYGSSVVFRNVSLTITRGDKTAIVGPNGAGKTTLLKILAGLIAPASGLCIAGHNTDIRYFGQHQLEQLDPERTLFETVQQASGSGDRTFIQNVLGAFLFSGDDVLKRVKVLSGGETSRLVLATILSRPGNVLILDEPTNHLDMQSVEMLTSALTEYPATVVFVSHNEYLISRVANRVVEIRPGIVRDFPGTISQYRSFLEAGYMKSEETATDGKKSGDTDAAKQDRIRIREERRQLQRKIERLEKDIELAEEEVKAADAILNDPANATKYSLLHDIAMTFETLKKKNEKLVVQWEELQGKLGQLEDL